MFDYANRARWRCTACEARGDQASYPGGRTCPRCGKNKVETNRCSSGLLCTAVGIPFDLRSGTGAGIHDSPELARACEERLHQRGGG